jgi:hypothetical protein
MVRGISARKWDGRCPPFRRCICLVQALTTTMRRRRIAAPVRPKPAISIAQLAGSGTPDTAGLLSVRLSTVA